MDREIVEEFEDLAGKTIVGAALSRGENTLLTSSDLESERQRKYRELQRKYRELRFREWELEEYKRLKAKFEVDEHTSQKDVSQ